MRVPAYSRACASVKCLGEQRGLHTADGKRGAGTMFRRFGSSTSSNQDTSLVIDAVYILWQGTRACQTHALGDALMSQYELGVRPAEFCDRGAYTELQRGRLV